jgi:type VI secretion system protein ImpH
VARKPLNQHLFDEPFAFEFFQAVRLLEKIRSDRKEVGGDALPKEEVVRFRSRIGFDFPPSEIHEIREVEDETGNDTRVEMLVNFMGMAGVSGVLPAHYTELVLDRIRHRDTAMWAFLDIFTHRAISLFYRAWAKYRFPLAYERGEEDFTGYLFDLCGLGTKGIRGRMDLEDEALLPYGGLIAQKPHTQNALQNIISDHFRVGARIEQFFGQWIPLGAEDVTSLGQKNSVLGGNAIIGTRVWDQQSKVRIRLGPLDFRRFQAFLPSGTANKALQSIVKFVVGFESDFDMQLLLEAKQVPGTVLTTRAIRRPMLGWTTWLKSIPFSNIDDQVILQAAE